MTMNIDQAIYLLCRVYTRDNAETGYTVEIGAAPSHAWVPEADFEKAWRVMREHCHMQVVGDVE